MKPLISEKLPIPNVPEMFKEIPGKYNVVLNKSINSRRVCCNAL